MICSNLYLKFKNYYDAIRYALKLDDNKSLMKRQCAYLLGWHQYMGYDEDEESDISDNEKETYIVVIDENEQLEDYEITKAY